MPVPDRRSVLSLLCGSSILPLAGPVWAQGAVRQLPLTAPDGLRPNLVTVAASRFQNRDAVAVALTDPAQAALRTPNAVGNGPSFAMPDLEFANGTIEVDIAAQINGRGPPDVRGFIGIAFHIAPDISTFEAVYLRMTNGSRNVPPPPAPRNAFAVQYISFPDRYWRLLREQHPNRYEQPAPVAIETWHTLRLHIRGSQLQASVDGATVLTVGDLRFPDRAGRIGLWVDDGTTGYFRDLRVTSA
ncbi:MAG: hypothetical protein EAZ99_00345 [Alphaproteobacteria bacterium]|nr:MAG: hypothetical protein EAZ99_00345 [Alphaproteobacteria bacterium]